MTLKKETPKKTTRPRKTKNESVKQTDNQPVLGVVGNTLWILTNEEPTEREQTLTIDGFEKPFPIEWVEDRNAFLAKLLMGYNLLENGDFSEDDKKSLKGWAIETGQSASAGIDLADEWQLTGGHTAFLLAAEDAPRPSFTIEQKIPVIADAEYKFSGYFATQRAEGLITLFYYDENHRVIGEDKIYIANQAEYSGGTSLNNYALIESVFTPSSGTKYLQFKIELGEQIDLTQANAYLFFTNLFLEIYDDEVESQFVKNYSPEVYRLNQLVAENYNYLGNVKLPTIYGKKQKQIVVDYKESKYKLIQFFEEDFLIDDDTANEEIQLLFKKIKTTTDANLKYEFFIYLNRLFTKLKKYAQANDCYLSAIKAIEFKPSIELDYEGKLEVITAPLVFLKPQVLIVGSAPTIENYKDQISNFKGEIWSLNDAWFWLEENGISVDKAFITDGRFIKHTYQKIAKTQCSTIVVIDHVNLDLIHELNKKVYIFRSLGRDGFSLKYGEVYHGCSVFFTALQTAVAMKYKEISCCGILLYPPSNYQRINGNSVMPEYVHSIQLNNVKKAKYQLDRLMIALNVFEPESNLNFL
jgi:hypothetical protein